MHPTTQALFDEHANPTHCGKRAIHDQLGPILDMIATVKLQVALYQQKRVAAKLADHDHAIDGKLELIKQTLKVVDTALSNFHAEGERAADALTQLDRTMAEARADIARHEATQPTKPA